jgi:hypothetical protein
MRRRGACRGGNQSDAARLKWREKSGSASANQLAENEMKSARNK